MTSIKDDAAAVSIRPIQPHHQTTPPTAVDDFANDVFGIFQPSQRLGHDILSRLK